MRAVGRVFAAILGWIAAILVAAAFLMVARVGLTPEDPDTAVLFWTQYALFYGFAVTLIGASTFYPAVLAILATEILGIRSLLVYLGIGGLFGLGAAFGLAGLWAGTGVVVPDRSDRLVALLAAGFVSGLTYWLIAGRMAGLMPERRDGDAAPPADRPI